MKLYDKRLEYPLPIRTEDVEKLLERLGGCRCIDDHGGEFAIHTHDLSDVMEYLAALAEELKRCGY